MVTKGHKLKMCGLCDLRDAPNGSPMSLLAFILV